MLHCKMQYLSLICMLLYLASAEEGQGPAWLLASKQIHNHMVVEDKELIVEYTIYNIGESVAVNTVLEDNTYPSESFEVVRGMLHAKWDRIAPNANVSHTVVLKPHIHGFFNMTSAEIRYQPSDESEDVQYGYTSSPGEGGIMRFRDYDRKFSPHILDWLAFSMMTLPSLCIPFLLWYRSKSKYESMSKQAKKQH